MLILQNKVKEIRKKKQVSLVERSPIGCDEINTNKNWKRNFARFPPPRHHLCAAGTHFSGCMINLASEKSATQPPGHRSKQAAGAALELLITKAITPCTAKQLPHDFMRAMLIYECNQLQPNAP